MCWEPQGSASSLCTASDSHLPTHLPPHPPQHRGVAPEALLAGYLEAIPAHEDHAIDEARPPPHLAHLFATELGDADLTAEDVRSSSSSSNG
mgnify:CR=1 FL=1